MRQYEEILTYHDRLQSIGIVPGLSRMIKASESLSHPEEAFPTIHIAGTNGKGSTAAMIAAALTNSGYKTGLFTSPAVTTLRDTIQIDGKAVDKSSFTQAANRVIDHADTPLSEFEWLTMVAFCCFEQEAVDIAVIECGLGGREDATNILPPPLCAVFTPIALDHTAFLGNTIAAIAKEKGGIIKPPCDVICHADMNIDALGILYETAATQGCRVWNASNHFPLTYGDQVCTVGMNGDHQLANAALVLTVLRCLEQKSYRFSKDGVSRALSETRLPCRMEIINTQPVTLLDGAHNPHGIAALCQWLAKHDKTDISLLIGMLKDKDCEEALRLLAPFCKEIVCCTPKNTPRPAMPAKELALLTTTYHKQVCAIDDPLAAYEYIKNSPATTIVVGGSFYTASTIRRFLQNV